MNRARCRGCIASMSGLCAHDPRQNAVSNNRCAQLGCADAAQVYLAYRMIGTADNQL
jgi:hypothetical protein